MKKLLIVLTSVLLLLFSSCQSHLADGTSSALPDASSNKDSTSSQAYVKSVLNADDIDSITITRWTSDESTSPTKKIITTKQTIKKIVDVWNEAELTEVFETVKPGTTLSVNIGEEFGFGFCGGYLITDKKTFKCSEDLQGKILEIYQNATEKVVSHNQDATTSSMPSGENHSHNNPELWKNISVDTFKVGEEKFIEFSSFTKNAKEVKCYLVPTTNKTDEIIYDTETAELIQEKDGCYIKGLKQGGVFLCIEVIGDNGEKYKDSVLVRFLNEM